MTPRADRRRLRVAGVLGNPIVLAAVALAVLGAEPAPAGAAPGADALAALINASAPVDNVYSAQFCGGALVAPDLVVTADHCVAERRPGSIDVIVGAGNLCRDAPIPGERRHVVEVVHHPEAGADRRADVALLRLDRPVDTAEPAALAPPAQAAQALHALGWGRQSAGGVPTCAPTTVPLEVAPPTECTEIGASSARVVVAERHLCAWPGPAATRNTCTGDSGGPVLDRLGALVGVVTWGPSCDVSSVGVYHRADDLTAWIQAVRSGEQ